MTQREEAAAKRERATAIHEAGHAVASSIIGRGIKRASIVATDDSLGHVIERGLPRKLFEAVEAGGVTPAQRAMIEDLIVVKLAGPEAERQFTGRRNHVGAGNDHEQVVDWVFRIYGDGRVASAWVHYAEIHTRVFVKRWWNEINAVADALIEERVLSASEVLRAMRGSLGIREI